MFCPETAETPQNSPVAGHRQWSPIWAVAPVLQRVCMHSDFSSGVIIVLYRCLCEAAVLVPCVKWRYRPRWRWWAPQRCFKPAETFVPGLVSGFGSSLWIVHTVSLCRSAIVVLLGNACLSPAISRQQAPPRPGTGVIPRERLELSYCSAYVSFC